MTTQAAGEGAAAAAGTDTDMPACVNPLVGWKNAGSGPESYCPVGRGCRDRPCRYPLVGTICRSHSRVPLTLPPAPYATTSSDCWPHLIAWVSYQSHDLLGQGNHWPAIAGLI